MSTATTRLSNAVNSSTEQGKYTQYAEEIQGAPLGSTVLLSACPGCFETSQQRGDDEPSFSTLPFSPVIRASLSPWHPLCHHVFGKEYFNAIIF